MKKIVILGSSPAAVAAIEVIGAWDQINDYEIILLSLDGCYPYNYTLFTSLLTGAIVMDQVFCKAKKFYQQQKVRVILDQKISRINFKRNRIFTESKEQIQYDVLLVTNSSQYKFPDIKGTNKTGVYRMESLADMQNMLNMLALTESVGIQSDCCEGLGMAEALMKMGKEVFWILSKELSENNFPDFYYDFEKRRRNEQRSGSCLIPQDVSFDLEERVKIFKENGGRVVSGNSIAEILGDSTVKAIRLNSGKVIASQIILFGDSEPNLKLFLDSPLEVNQKIAVNEQFQTNLKNVFALGDVVAVEGFSSKQGTIAGESIIQFLNV